MISIPHESLEETVGGATAGGEGTAEAESGRADGEDDAVNYDEAALLELEIDGTDYRLDVGRAGTALCISTRQSGRWSWTFRGEARWQANMLRCKSFDRDVLTRLSQALAEAAASSQS